MTRDYQLIRIGSLWHLTQQQARPPARSELHCHTSCGKWAEMKDGYTRGRPDCPTCLEHVHVFEDHVVEEAVAYVNTKIAGPVSIRDRVARFTRALRVTRRRRLVAL
jgi:hypothetical protein